MKRVNILLDETTIINIPFFMKLVKRYIYITVLTPVLAFVIASVLYMGQKIIYTSQINFKLMSEETNSASGAIASLLGEKKAVISPEEVVASVRSIDFIQELSEKIVERDDFTKLDFDNYVSKKHLSNVDIFGPCFDDQKCKILTLRSRLSGLYIVSADRQVDNRFTVVVKTADPYTTKILLNELRNLMQSKRIKEIKRKLIEQYKITKSLIDEKKSGATLVDSSRQLNEVERAKLAMESIVSKLSALSSVYESKKLELSQAEMRMNKTDEIYKQFESSLSVNNFSTKYKELQKSVKDTRSDIADLEVTMKNPSKQDLAVISKLKEELKAKERELLAFQKNRSIASNNGDDKGTSMSPNQARFKYDILKGQVTKLAMDHSKILKEKEIISNKLLDMKLKFEQLRPSNEYLKLLEQKLLQLKLLESTIVSDFVFDKFASPVFNYKRTSLSKVSFFGVFLSIFFLIVAITVSYMLDGRIYDEYELKKKFSDLEVIGKTPDFY